MLIIDRLELDFSNGLNVLTGETGAGKSILLDSLGFVLGWRGRADLVRQGCDQGEVTAWFDIHPSDPVCAVLSDAGFDVENELILRRINTKDGRKTAWINDRRVSGEMLRAVSDHLIELHGQHDDRGLLDPKGHRTLLDAFGGYGDALDAVAGAWKELARLRRALTELEKSQSALQAEEEFLRHAVDELEKIAPEAEEEADLDARRRMMQSAERIKGDVAKAAQAIGREAAEAMVADAVRWLEGAAENSPANLGEALAILNRVLIDLQEASDCVERCLEDLDFNPYELEQVEERLFALRGLARKHKVSPQDLPNLAQELSDRLSRLDRGQEDRTVLERDIAQAQAQYDKAAAGLTSLRIQAADKLDKAMVGELAPLKMERAVFTTEITPVAAGPEGVDQVDFMVATNPGAPAGPIAKIASGGELSRFLLALKVCLSQDRQSATLIFDEIDRGVGGATADAVGRRLSALAAGGQVLVVTHSPQVAALGDRHFQVSKRQTDLETISTVVVLDPDARIDEIARMISSDKITDVSRAAAQELLANRA